MTTFPERFKEIHLAVCSSTNDYLKENLARLEADFPVMVSASAQVAGRGRDRRGWFSKSGLGLYATFAFALGHPRRLPLLSLASGVAVADALASWTGRELALKWPNDIVAAGKKIAGILCENIIAGEKISCLVGVGVNLNHREGDFPKGLRERAGSLRMLTGAEWPVDECGRNLAAGMAAWMRRLEADAEDVLGRARDLSRPFLGREISFHHRGRIWQGVCRGLAATGGLQVELADGEVRIFYDGEMSDPARPE